MIFGFHGAIHDPRSPMMIPEKVTKGCSRRIGEDEKRRKALCVDFGQATL